MKGYKEKQQCLICLPVLSRQDNPTFSRFQRNLMSRKYLLLTVIASYPESTISPSWRCGNTWLTDLIWHIQKHHLSISHAKLMVFHTLKFQAKLCHLRGFVLYVSVGPDECSSNSLFRSYKISSYCIAWLLVGTQMEDPLHDYLRPKIFWNQDEANLAYRCSSRLEIG